MAEQPDPWWPLTRWHGVGWSREVERTWVRLPAKNRAACIYRTTGGADGTVLVSTTNDRGELIKPLCPTTKWTDLITLRCLLLEHLDPAGPASPLPIRKNLRR